MGCGSIASNPPFAKQGKIRMIAITSGKRSAAAPDIPTVGETLKGYEMTVERDLRAERHATRGFKDE